MSMSLNVEDDLHSNKSTSNNPTKKRKNGNSSREHSTKKQRRLSDTIEIPPESSSVTHETKKEKKKRHPRAEDVEIDESSIKKENSSQDIELPDMTKPEGNETEIHGENIYDELGGTTSVELQDFMKSESPSSFYSTRISLYVSIPAVSLETASSSILSKHLAPLLLTFFPPARGVVLAFSDPVLSAKSDNAINLPLIGPEADPLLQEQSEVLARAADDFGVCWVWLTASFLVFRPDRDDELYGWINAMGEGLIGLVSYNYFQTAVGKDRIPSEWTWKDSRIGMKKGKKARLRDENNSKRKRKDELEDDLPGEDTIPNQTDLEYDTAYYLDGTGSKVSNTLKFKIVDTEMVSDKDKWSLQIYGSLLDKEAEEKVRNEERSKFDQGQRRSRSQTPGNREMDGVMSGGLASSSREGSMMSIY